MPGRGSPLRVRIAPGAPPKRICQRNLHLARLAEIGETSTRGKQEHSFSHRRPDPIPYFWSAECGCGGLLSEIHDGGLLCRLAEGGNLLIHDGLAAFAQSTLLRLQRVSTAEEFSGRQTRNWRHLRRRPQGGDGKPLAGSSCQSSFLPDEWRLGWWRSWCLNG